MTDAELEAEVEDALAGALAQANGRLARQAAFIAQIVPGLEQVQDDLAHGRRGAAQETIRLAIAAAKALEEST